MSDSPSTSCRPRDFYTREELAERMRVGIRTVDDWMAAGKISCFSVGRVVRFSRQAVEEFELAHTILARGGGLQGLQVANAAQSTALLKTLAPFVQTLIERELERKQVAA